MNALVLTQIIQRKHKSAGAAISDVTCQYNGRVGLVVHCSALLFMSNPPPLGWFKLWLATRLRILCPLLEAAKGTLMGPASRSLLRHVVYILLMVIESWRRALSIMGIVCHLRWQS